MEFLTQGTFRDYYTTRTQNVNFRYPVQGVFQKIFCIRGVQEDHIKAFPASAQVLHVIAAQDAGLLFQMGPFQVFPDQLLLMFDAGENMLSIGRVALRVASLSYVFAGFCIATGSIFQALGNGVYSMIVSFCRQIVVLLPAAYLLSLTGELNAVWWAIPIAELMSLTASGLLLVRIYRKIIRNIPDNE